MIECPTCHAQAPEDAPDEVLRQKFYRQRHPGYYTCLECTRRFSVKTGLVVS